MRPYKEGSQIYEKPRDMSIEHALALERERVQLKSTLRMQKYRLRKVSFELKQMELIERDGCYVGRCPKCEHSVYLDAKSDKIIGHIRYSDGRPTDKCTVRRHSHQFRCDCSYKGDENE